MNVKTCTKCGEAKALDEFSRDASRKDGRGARCRVCDRAKSRAWAQENPGKARDRGRNWYEANRDAVLESARDRASSNREQLREYAAEWRSANPDYDSARRRGNPEAYRDKVNRRRARKVAAGVFEIPSRELRRLYASPCVACGAVGEIELDHVVPIARGGRHSIGNLQALCGPCNRSKGAKLFIEWRAAKLAG